VEFELALKKVYGVESPGSKVEGQTVEVEAKPLGVRLITSAATKEGA
jgi:hypothetical protein